MSTQRTPEPVQNYRIEGQGRAAKIIYWCKQCGASPLPKRRTSFCGPECSREWNIRNNPTYARAIVEQRDKGVCALCGLDTVALHKGWRKREIAIQRWADERITRSGLRRQRGTVTTQMSYHPDMYSLTVEWQRYFGRNYSPGYSQYRVNLWDMDHIIPVADGGGQCGLDNLRTLCIPCHRQVTRAWRRARAGMQPAPNSPQGELFSA